MKKFLVLLAIVAAICVGVCFSALAAEATNYTGSVEELEPLVTKIEAADSTADGVGALKNVEEYLIAYPVNPDASGYEEVYTRLRASACALVAPLCDAGDVASVTSAARIIADYSLTEQDGVNATGYAAAVKGALESLLSQYSEGNTGNTNASVLAKCATLLRSHKATGVESAEIDALCLDYEARVAEYSALVEERRSALDESNPLPQYFMPVIVDTLTWDEGNPETRNENTAKDKGYAYGMQDLMGVCAVNDIGYRNALDGDNGYFYLRYSKYESKLETADSGVHTYTYMYVNNKDLGRTPTLTNGLVMEFDATTFMGLPKDGIGIEHSTVDRTDGVPKRAQPFLFTINSDGTLKGNHLEKTKEVYVEPGRWTHFTIVYDGNTYMAKIYADYELIMEVDTRPYEYGKCIADYYEFLMFRFGTSNSQSSSGDFAIDNFIAYEGSSVRSIDRVDNMSNDEKMIFYCENLLREDLAILDLKFTYELVGENLRNYWDGEDYTDYAKGNEELMAAIDTYLAFDYDAMYHKYITANLNELVLLKDDLTGITRTIESIAERTAALSRCDLHIKTYDGEYLDDENGLLARTLDEIERVRDEIREDNAIVDFCGYVDRFYSSVRFSVNAQRKHYNNATQALNSCNRTLIGVEGFESYTEAYRKYLEADELLAQSEMRYNSSRVVDCVKFISEYDTEAEWVENYNYVNKYVLIIREIVREGNLDMEYEGIHEALDIYAPINDYFYSMLQAEHVKVFEEQIARLTSTDSYIEKMGACVYLENYIASNDIDENNATLAGYRKQLGIYRSELEAIKSDYKDILAEYTIRFSGTVKLMKIASDYEEMVALYNEATLYYSSMNVGDESIASDLAYYDSVTEKIARAEEASSLLLEAVARLSLADNADEKYAALVDCYCYNAYAEDAIEGVAEARAIYEQAYNEYMNAKVTVESEISSANVAIGSVRANTGMLTVVAVIIEKIFG